MTPFRTHLLAALMLIALVAAGCGDDDEPSKAATVPRALTEPSGARQEQPRDSGPGEVNPAADTGAKKGFIEDTSAACTAGARRLTKVQRDLAEAGRGDQAELQRKLSEALKEQIEITEGTTAKLSEIKPPAVEKKRYARFLKLRGEVAEVQTDYRDAVAGRDAEKLSALAQKQARAERQASGLAALMGIENC